MSYGLIVTTASNIEGYRIIEYLDMVFGEIAVHGANIQEKGVVGTWGKAMASWGASTEYGNQTKVVRGARSEAYNQITNEARKLGANAIIGIHTDNTITGDLVFVSMYGTAVKIEADKQEQKRIEHQQRESKFAVLLDETKQRKASGDMDREIEFLKRMRDMDSVMKIWNLWTESGLGETYREIEALIKRGKDSERMYGKSSNYTEQLKQQIEKTLMEV